MKAFRAVRLERELRFLAFNALTRLCGRIGRLPESYLLPNELDLSGLLRASGGFAEVRVGVSRGKYVAIKSLKVSEVDDEMRIRKVGDQTTSSHRLTHSPYSTSVKKLSCGRTCPILTSSVRLEFLTPSRMEDSRWSLNGWSTGTSWSTFGIIPATT